MKSSPSRYAPPPSLLRWAVLPLLLLAPFLGLSPAGLTEDVPFDPAAVPMKDWHLPLDAGRIGGAGEAGQIEGIAPFDLGAWESGRLQTLTYWPPSETDPPADALHYDLDLTFGLSDTTIYGTATLTVRWGNSGASTLRLDLVGLAASAVRDGAGASLSFAQDGTGISITVTPTPAPGDTVTVAIDYGGHPTSAFYNYADAAYTMTEPEDSRLLVPLPRCPLGQGDALAARASALGEDPRRQRCARLHHGGGRRSHLPLARGPSAGHLSHGGGDLQLHAGDPRMDGDAARLVRVPRPRRSSRDGVPERGPDGGLLRLDRRPLPLRQVRDVRGQLRRRDGAPERDVDGLLHLHQRPHLRMGDRTRTRPPVVRRSGDLRRLGAYLAQRGVRHLLRGGLAGGLLRPRQVREPHALRAEPRSSTRRTPARIIPSSIPRRSTSSAASSTTRAVGC